MGKSVEGIGRTRISGRGTLEVCAAFAAGCCGDIVSTCAFEARGSVGMTDFREGLAVMRTVGRNTIAVSILCLGILAASAMAQGELRFCLRSEPKTFDPLKVEDDASVAIRYLTGGVLLRMNRQTQALEPELAESWKVSKDGKQITFKLRSGISFSAPDRATWRPSSFRPARFPLRFQRPWPDSTGSSIRSRFFPHTPPRRKW